MSSPIDSVSEWSGVTEDLPVSEILTKYLSGVQQLASVVSDMTESQVRAVPVPGTWSTLGVICHLVDFDLVYAERMHRVLAEEQTPLRGGDPDQFACCIDESHRQWQQEIQVLQALRHRMAGILGQLPHDVWSRVGIHSTDGPLSLKTLLVRVTNHVPHHVKFIQQKRIELGLPAWPVDRSGKRPEHLATIRWSGNGTGFLKGQYSREHTWTFDGGITVPASPSPHVVPQPWSSEAAIDPEEAYVASVASCHMLTFLWLASKAGLIVTHYEDTAAGTMTKNERRVSWVSKITLQPSIEWGGERQPTTEEVATLHHQAHEQCFIANSIRTEVVVAGADSNVSLRESRST